MGAEHACHRVKAEGPELLEKTLIKGLSEGGVCCRRKARARTAVGVGSQRELGCHENSAADSLQAQVHLAVGVTENSVAGDLLGEGVGILELIVFFSAYQNHQALTDTAAEFTVGSNRRF